MPRIVPILPPTSEDSVKDGLVQLLKVAKALNLNLDVNGFTHAWLSDYTRVFVATEGDTPVGMGILAYGTQYHAPEEISASILLVAGPARKELLEFMRDSALMLGAKFLLYEAEEGDTLGGELSRVTKLRIA
jgi:hypothetical protein